VGANEGRISVRAALGIAAIAALLLASVAGASSVRRDGSGAAKVRHVTLDRGTLLGEPWHSAIFRASKRSHQPCFELATQGGGFSSFIGLCGRPRRGFVPILMSDSGDHDSKGTVTLVVTPLHVHRVRLNFGRRADKEVWPKRIGPRKARKAGLKPDFKHKSLALRGRFCLRRHVDYDADGEVVFRSSRYPPCRRQRAKLNSASAEGGYAIKGIRSR
jgi:hypothetical protein